MSKGLKRVPGPDPQYEDICFGQAPAHQDLEALSQVFPSMEIQFDQVGGWVVDGRYLGLGLGLGTALSALLTTHIQLSEHRSGVAWVGGW